MARSVGMTIHGIYLKKSSYTSDLYPWSVRVPTFTIPSLDTDQECWPSYDEHSQHGPETHLKKCYTTILTTSWEKDFDFYTT